MKKQLATTLGLAVATGGLVLATTGPAQAQTANNGLHVLATTDPAQAQSANNTGLQNEIKKVEDVAGMLSGLVTAFTTVLVTPMGISAAIKVFKTLVLFNL